jgi:cell division protein FtsW
VSIEGIYGELGVSLAGRLYLALAGILLGIGVLMVYSASMTSRPTEFERVYLLRQVAAAGLGLIAAFVASRLTIGQWRRLTPWLFLAVLVLLVAVLIPGVGTKVKGARRWLRIAGVSVQPSELAKIVLPLWTCLLITTRQADLRHWWRGTVSLLWPTLLLVPLVLVEPDLGTAAFLSLGTVIALYLGGWPATRFALGLLLLLPASMGLWLLKPYQIQRITGFVETWQDLDAAPYQIRQSLVTMGTGGWWGTGLGQGWQKLSFLPEANTDFVFAVIGEELGLSGTLGLVAIWCGLYLSGIRLLSDHGPRSFEFLAGATLLTQLVLQAIFNIAVVTALVPPKGISHPLISAGGSNLVVSLLILGIVWSLAQGARQRIHHPGLPPISVPRVMRVRVG